MGKFDATVDSRVEIPVERKFVGVGTSMTSALSASGLVQDNPFSAQSNERKRILDCGPLQEIL